MTNIIAVNSNSTQTVASGDLIYVGRDVSIITDGASYLSTAAGIALNVDGTLFSFNGSTVQFQDPGLVNGGNIVVVGESGVIRTSAVGAAIYLGGQNNVVQNWGEISGFHGIYLNNGDFSRIENHGAISSSVTAFQACIVLGSASAVDLYNDCVISGYSCIRFGGSDGTVTNAGVIHGNSAGSYGIDGYNLSSGGLKLFNSGKSPPPPRPFMPGPM
jgi:hypothetical protein